MSVRRQALNRLAIRACVSCALVGAIGCGGGTTPVSGEVRHNGVAVTAGRVVFRPQGEGKLAFGPIESDGTFRLMTTKPGDGAGAGSYRVMIAGDAEAADAQLRTTYLAPKEPPLEVIAGQENKFIIDVREAEGWQAVRPK
jgi:hypothetical protein